MPSGFPLVSSSELIVVHSSAEATLAVVLVMLLVVGCWLGVMVRVVGLEEEVLRLNYIVGFGKRR
jgi:hypothetical protein